MAEAQNDVRALLLLPYPRNRVPGQRYRVEQWIPYVAAAGVEVRVIELLRSGDLDTLHSSTRLLPKVTVLFRSFLRALGSLRAVRRADVVYLHRTLLLAGPALVERIIARLGAPIVYDFDDAIWVTKTTEANRALARFKFSGKTATLCRLADAVVPGTDLLAEYARRFNSNVTVIPPTIDTDRYRPPPPRPTGGPVVIGWSGSPTTVEYLALVAPALARLAAELSIEVRLMGADFDLPGVPKVFTPWSAKGELAELQRYDIGLMPLADDDWTRGKGAMKALLSMSVGVPVVASPVGITPTIVRQGETGLLAASSEEWFQALRSLARDAELRRRLGCAGRKLVEEHYAAKVQGPRFAAVLIEAASRSRRRWATVGA